MNTQELITKISNKENLSESKGAGIFVEETLTTRVRLDIQNPTELRRDTAYRTINTTNNSFFIQNYLDKLISQRYNLLHKNHNHASQVNPAEQRNNRNSFNHALFE